MSDPDNLKLSDAEATRRYFRKFEKITSYLGQVALDAQRHDRLSNLEAAILQGYFEMIGNTFSTMSFKYLMSGRVSEALQSQMELDATNSGFPIYPEILKMANDALQANNHLRHIPDHTALLEDMVRQILSDQEVPKRLQYTMSQKLYYEQLRDKPIFWAQNHPEQVWVEALPNGRHEFVVHWAVYDSLVNLPMIYVMTIEDAGKRLISRDDRRWPRLQSHLLAQSLSSLKLISIAQGIDRDFEDLHPKLLRRFRVGPMHSRHFTRQTGIVQKVLDDASAPSGQDWILNFEVETLRSQSEKSEKTGIFSSQDIQIYDLDVYDPRAGDRGLSELNQAVMMPHSVYQTVQELKPVELENYRKYVVTNEQKLLVYK